MAVKALLDGKRGMMVGSVNQKIEFTPFEDAIKKHQAINLDLMEISEILSI